MFGFDLLSALTTLPGILLGFTFHEYAHAYMATKFGDPTPAREGRLTLNPMSHIDLWGLLLIIFLRFGWAKPVHTNPSYYRGDIRKKDLIVSMAGPVTNLLIAVIFALLFSISSRYILYAGVDYESMNILRSILFNGAWINCVLFIFNLVPIPPLDGFHVLSNLVPPSSYDLIYNMERYGYIILLVFILSPVSNLVVGRGAQFVMSTIFSLMGMA